MCEHGRLFGKLKQVIAEMREDANETAIRESLGTSPKSHDDKAKPKRRKNEERKPKAPLRHKVGEAADAAGSQSTVLPGKPKTVPKDPGSMAKVVPKARGESLRHRKRPEREHLQRRPTPRLRVCFGPKARVTVARTARLTQRGRSVEGKVFPPPLSPTLPPCVTRVRCNRLCHLPRQSQIQPWIWSKLALISQV